MKKYMSEETALIRLADYCARGEHSSGELLERLAHWEIPEDARMRIMKQLAEQCYFDDERYARAYIKDKLRYQKWGRRKIEQGLWSKHISDDIRQRTLDEVDDEEYVAILHPLLQQKRRTIRAASDYERNGKLIQYALGRGYTMDIIRQCLQIEDEDQYLA